MDYIESNLTGTIDAWEAVRIVGCSEYLFRRMFAFIAGVPMSEYIRHRRLAQAALDLHRNNSRVSDIALRYGYRSPDSFARVFLAMHGISPAAATEENAVYRTWPWMTFYLAIQGGRQMDVRIEERSAFRCV